MSVDGVQPAAGVCGCVIIIVITAVISDELSAFGCEGLERAPAKAVLPPFPDPTSVPVCNFHNSQRFPAFSSPQNRVQCFPGLQSFLKETNSPCMAAFLFYHLPTSGQTFPELFSLHTPLSGDTSEPASFPQTRCFSRILWCHREEFSLLGL